MNTVTSEQFIDLDQQHENYEYVSDEKVMKISRYLLIKHEEAYKALANA